MLAALSSLRLVETRSSLALSLSPAVAASRKARIAVRSEDLTDWLRSRLRSLVRIRFTWDLMLATPEILSSVLVYCLLVTVEKLWTHVCADGRRYHRWWADLKRVEHDAAAEVISKS